MAVRIRVATVADAPAIGRVHVRSWQAAYRGQIPDAILNALSVERRAAMWRRSLEHPESPANRLWVAEVDGGVVGFAATGPTRDADADARSTGEVYAIYLEREHWGRKIGRSLFEEATAEMRRQGFCATTLWVLDTNERTRRFYEAAGWRTDGAVKTEIREGVELREVRYRRTF